MTTRFEHRKLTRGYQWWGVAGESSHQATAAVGLYARSGRGGGTYAHRDIAFEFASWLSPEFKLYLIKEFQRLKDEESRAASHEWRFQRTLAKVNYRIHTDAIQEHLIPSELTKAQINVVYASEADLLNVALFGITAADWRAANHPEADNMRDVAGMGRGTSMPTAASRSRRRSSSQSRRRQAETQSFRL